MPGGVTKFGTAGSNISFYSLVGGTSGSGGSGTVTSISAGSGMSFATITTTGAVAIDVLKVPYISGGFSTGLLKWSGSNWTFDNTTYYPASNPSGFTAGGSGSGLSHGTASGVDTYTVTISGVASYADGDAYLIRFISGNTTSATLNINSLGAIALYRNNDGPLIGGDIVDGAEMLCVYNSTSNAFQCIGTAPNTLLAYVTNAESTTITKGQPVYVYGGTGDRITVKLAYNTSDITSAQTIGVVQSTSIAANQKGLIIIQGQLDNLSLFPTSTWADGDYIYLGATAGSITNVKPVAPNHLVYLGYVTTASNGSAGRMYVKVQNGYELDEIHNVQLSGVTNNDVLAYNSADSLWKNKPISGVLGYVPQAQLSGTGVVKSTAGTISYISGTSDQYIDGTGSLQTFPSITKYSSNRPVATTASVATYGAWYRQFWPSTAATTNTTLNLNQLWLMPVQLPAGLVINEIAFTITTAGSAGALVSVGIYSSTTVSGEMRADALLSNFGSVSTSTNGRKVITSLNYTVPSGTTDWYWIALLGTVAAPGNISFISSAVKQYIGFTTAGGTQYSAWTLAGQTSFPATMSLVTWLTGVDSASLIQIGYK